jgi:hypothetical protein
MLTAKQAAQRACVSLSLVYLWCANGLLQHYRLGGKGKRGKIVIEETELDSFLAECKVKEGGNRPPPVLKHITLS